MREGIASLFVMTKYRWWMLAAVALGALGLVVGITLHPVGIAGLLASGPIFCLAAFKGYRAGKEAATGRPNDWPYGTDER